MNEDTVYISNNYYGYYYHASLIYLLSKLEIKSAKGEIAFSENYF